MEQGQVYQWLAEIGADLAGVVPSADWASYLPSDIAHRSIVIFGAGGPDFIRRCQAHAAVHGDPEHWLSDYAQYLFEARLGPSPRYLNPYRTGLNFPFMRAAIAAGIGVMGLNHVVLTPRWGPWFSLLGAIVLGDESPATGPTDFDPCTECPATCLAACPSGAVSKAGYDGYKCITTKLKHAPCLHACPARHACVLRPDLRREMIGLESSRYKSDVETRSRFETFLQGRNAAGR